MHHDLKIWPQYFERVKDGSKTFEVRDNDRGFQPGDTVTLKEFIPSNPDALMHVYPYNIGSFTQREIGPFKVGYVLPIDNNRVVFSLLEPKE